METVDPLALACRALPVVTGQFAELVVTAPDLSVLARASRWTVREVAVHVAVGARAFADLASESNPSLPGMADLSAEIERRMADVSETDPGKLAALTQDAIEDFVDAWVDRPADFPLDWAGCPITAATLAGVLLGEVVMHGYDMAYAPGPTVAYRSRPRRPHPRGLRAAVPDLCQSRSAPRAIRPAMRSTWAAGRS